MRLKVGRVSIDDPQEGSAVARALAALDCAGGEDWTARARSRHGGWELVLQGPRRNGSNDAAWQVQPLRRGRARYRRTLRGDEQRVEYVESAVRQLLWEKVQFRDNPLWRHDPRLGRAFEQAVWTVLREQGGEPLQVRFNVWRGAPDRLSFVCKVESAGTAGGGLRGLPWRWWSPLVQTPDELSNQLTEAVRRRQQQAAVPLPA